MSFGNALIEIERIKELSLISGLASHHRRNPLANRENGITPLRLRQRVFQQHRSKLPVRATAAFRRMACRRFCGRQESLFDGTGGGSWRDGNSIELEDPAP